MKNIGEPYLNLFAQSDLEVKFCQALQTDVSLDRDFCRVLLTWRGLLPDAFIAGLEGRLRAAGKDPPYLATLPRPQAPPPMPLVRPPLFQKPEEAQAVRNNPPARPDPQVKQEGAGPVQISPNVARILNDLKVAATLRPPHYDGQRVAALMEHLRRIDLDPRFVGRVDELARLPHKQPLVDLIDRALAGTRSHGRKRSLSPPSHPQGRLKRHSSHEHLDQHRNEAPRLPPRNAPGHHDTPRHHEEIKPPSMPPSLPAELSQSLPDLLSALSKSLPGLSESFIPLTYAELTKPRPHLHPLLYGQLRPLQCKQCGMRWGEQDRQEMEAHLDAHFRRNMRLKDKSKRVLAREWYPAVSDWIAGVIDNQQAVEETVINVFEETTAESKVMPVVPVKELRVPVEGGDQTELDCVVCGERIAVVWDDEIEQWMYRNATRNVNGQVCHASCID